MIRIQILHALPKNLSSILRPMRPRRKLIKQSLRQPRIKVLVITLMVSNRGPEGREIEHDSALTPLLAAGAGRVHLPQQIIVGLTELDVDAGAVGGSHGPAGRGLGVEELAHALE